jgi:hypothetical protein
LFLALALAPILSACGGGAGSCGKVGACGGDVVGTYTISAGCVNTAALNMQIIEGCAGAKINSYNTSITGSGSFNADMTYTLNETVTLSASETLPASCLTQDGLTLTCAQVDALLQSAILQDPTVFKSAHCTGSSSCTCTFTLAPQTMTQTGTYTTAGTTLTTLSSTGTPGSNEYCVKGNELHVMQVDMTMPMAVIQSDIVFHKN